MAFVQGDGNGLHRLHRTEGEKHLRQCSKLGAHHQRNLAVEYLVESSFLPLKAASYEKGLRVLNRFLCV